MLSAIFFNCFSLHYPPGTHGFPQKMSASSVQPFGQLQLTHLHKYIYIFENIQIYIYTGEVLFYIDIKTNEYKY